MPNLVLRLNDSDDDPALNVAEPAMDRAAGPDPAPKQRDHRRRAGALGLELHLRCRPHAAVRPRAPWHLQTPLRRGAALRLPGGTLYRREQAAFLLSQRLGWDIVPPTVVRDGPHGIGTVQLYIEPTIDQVDETEFWLRDAPEIEPIVLFDHIATTPTARSGHCLLDQSGKVWGIDTA